MKISIYGTGWLGEPLANELTNRKHEVLSPSWRAKIQEPLSYWKPLIQSPIQVWSIPPRIKQNGPEFYDIILTEWIQFAHNFPIEKMIFLSSTSVYEPSNDLITEQSSINSNSTISKAEQIIISSGLPYLIIRLGGLMGADRYVAKYYSGKELEKSNGRINYLHLEDAVFFISQAIERDLYGIYNLVAPEHPTRKEVVIASCKKHQLPLPTAYIENEDTFKIISSEKILKALSMDFKHPDPLRF